MMDILITILTTFGFAFALAFILGFLLGLFKKLFAVERDPIIDKIRDVLPGANCGACGYPGCDGYAEAVGAGSAAVNLCTSGGKKVAEDIAALMGVTANAVDMVAVIRCQGTKNVAPEKGKYVGVQTCRAAKLSVGGTKLCAWGCLGFGDCTKACKFGAIAVGTDGIVHVDYSKCVGCGMCALECPQKIIEILPRDTKGAIALCSNRNTLKANVLKTCKVGCIKCEACVRACPTGAITMVDGLPVIDRAKCTSCGACVEKCPTKVLKIYETEVL